MLRLRFEVEDLIDKAELKTQQLKFYDQIKFNKCIKA